MTTNLSANSHTDAPIDAPITDGGETNAVPITVTILDAATIFEGPDSVYRYDLPGTGIVEGWALGQVMDQISKLAGPSWPDVEACVVAGLVRHGHLRRRPPPLSAGNWKSPGCGSLTQNQLSPR